MKKHKVTCGDSCPLLSGQPCGCDGKGPAIAAYPGYGQPAGYPGGYPGAPMAPNGYYPPPGAYQPYQAVQPAGYPFHG